ncbi:MAG: InlB B-repeat-containing protein [Lachnospiraceae bacterium]|nr:InlB B-repeat-containing protein [Lachnospiraceae bacterium]
MKIEMKIERKSRKNKLVVMALTTMLALAGLFFMTERVMAADDVEYFDPLEKKVKTIDDVHDITVSENELNNAWYVVQSDIVINNRITVSGNVNLILSDGKTLTVKGGISVEDNDNDPANGSPNVLKIYGQSEGTGTLLIDSVDNYCAGIGGGYLCNGGKITINGGTVTATGGNKGAGIGGRDSGNGGKITINGGTVTATGGNLGGAGIGGGDHGNGGKITINGGTVTATGGSYGAGIGGGNSGAGGEITINGGTVEATGGDFGAGIGGGLWGSGGNITISGGTVTATGGDSGAGIGAGKDSNDHGSITLGTSVYVFANASSAPSPDRDPLETSVAGGKRQVTGTRMRYMAAAVRHVVTFEKNGHGTQDTPAIQYVAPNGSAANPGTLSDDDWIFGGWFSDTACVNVYDFNTPVTADLTLYACWKKTSAIDEETEWNLYEDASEHEFRISGICASKTVENSNVRSKVYYDAKLSGSVITVRVKGERKKAAENGILEFDLGEAGVVAYVLPVCYTKPVLKLRTHKATIRTGTETVLRTTILEKTADGSFAPLDMTDVKVSGSGLGIKVMKGADGSVEIKTAVAGKAVITVRKDTWEYSNPVSLSFDVNGSSKDVLEADLGGRKSVVLNSNAKNQSFVFDLRLNGVLFSEMIDAEKTAADLVTIIDKKSSGLATISKDGKLVIAYRNGVKCGIYTITLKAGDTKKNVRIKVSDKALNEAITLKVLRKYDVVTKQGMIIVPVLKDVGGSIKSVSVSEEGFSAKLNAAGNIEIGYTGNTLNANNLNIGTLTLALTLEGVDDPVRLTLSNLKAKKSRPKANTAKLTIPSSAMSADGKVIGVVNVLSTKQSATGILTVSPEKAEIIDMSKGVVAKVNENDPSEIDIISLSKSRASVKVKLGYAGCITGNVKITVKREK